MAIHPVYLKMQDWCQKNNLFFQDQHDALRGLTEDSAPEESDEFKDNQSCTKCEKKLDYEKIVWLELNSHTGVYTLPGMVPEEESQGVFPFGAACAQKQLGLKSDWGDNYPMPDCA